MGSFLGKLVVIGVIVVAAVVLVNKFKAFKEQPKPEPKTFYDVIEEDDKRLRADIEPPKPVETEQVKKVAQAKVAEPEEITIENQVQAERLFEMAITERKIARLPGTSYKNMVDYCREIIEKYPNSPQAPKAKRMLGEVPQRYWKRYKITEEEINPSR